MNPTDPLAKLKELHLPPPGSIFPFAPGWWILGCLSLLLLAGLIFFGIRYYRASLPRKKAIREWKQLQQNYTLNQDASVAIRELSMLLRRMALSTHSRNKVARLQGEDWLTFLDQTTHTSFFSPKKRSGQDSSFCEGAGKLFATAPYCPDSSTVAPETMDIAFDLSLNWLKTVKSSNKNSNNISQSFSLKE